MEYVKVRIDKQEEQLIKGDVDDIAEFVLRNCHGKETLIFDPEDDALLYVFDGLRLAVTTHRGGKQLSGLQEALDFLYNGG